MHRDTLAGEHMESLTCPNVDDYYEDLDVMNTYAGECSTQVENDENFIFEPS